MTTLLVGILVAALLIAIGLFILQRKSPADADKVVETTDSWFKRLFKRGDNG